MAFCLGWEGCKYGESLTRGGLRSGFHKVGNILDDGDSVVSQPCDIWKRCLAP